MAGQRRFNNEMMTMLLWLVLTAGFAALLLHPYATYPLSLAIRRWWRGEPPITTDALPSPADPPPIDLVFCAYNEGAFIERKIENCLAISAAHPHVRIHVYSDGSTDGTNAILARYADRLRFVAGAGRQGKSVGMNMLLAGCRGSSVVFTDANVLLDSAGFAALPRYFADPSIGCLCGHLIYTNDRTSPTAAVGSFYWRLEEKIKTLESQTGSVMGADGSIFAIRRELFREVPNDIIDDYFTSFSILCDGWRLVRAPELRAYERSAERQGEEFRRKVRIACRSFNAHRLLWPRLRQLPAWDLYKYLSHKLVRWFSALWLGLGLVTSLAFIASIGWLLPGLASGFVVALAMIAGVRFAKIRALQAVFDIFVAYLATGYGIWRSLRGDRFRTWEAAATAR